MGIAKGFFIRLLDILLILTHKERMYRMKCETSR